MTVDSQQHVIEPQTGFAIDKDTGHIVGLMQMPEKRVSRDHEYPAWVVPHDSQVVRRKADGAPDTVSTPGFVDFHVNRVDGVVTVLIKDAEEEARALAAYEEPKAHAEPEKEAAPIGASSNDKAAEAERAKWAELDRKIAADNAALEADEAARRALVSLDHDDAERKAAEQLAADERSRSITMAGTTNPT